MDALRRVRVLLPVLALSLTTAACGEPLRVDVEEAWSDDEFEYGADIIAFETNRDGNREIYLMTDDGSDGIVSALF